MRPSDPLYGGCQPPEVCVSSEHIALQCDIQGDDDDDPDDEEPDPSTRSCGELTQAQCYAQSARCVMLDGVCREIASISCASLGEQDCRSVPKCHYLASQEFANCPGQGGECFRRWTADDCGGLDFNTCHSYSPYNCHCDGPAASTVPAARATERRGRGNQSSSQFSASWHLVDEQRWLDSS